MSFKFFLLDCWIPFQKKDAFTEINLDLRWDLYVDVCESINK